MVIISLVHCVLCKLLTKRGMWEWKMIKGSQLSVVAWRDAVVTNFMSALHDPKLEFWIQRIIVLSGRQLFSITELIIPC